MSAWTVCRSERLLVLFALLLLPTLGHANMQYYDLHVGEVRSLSVGEIERVAVGNESVLNVSVLDSGELLLIPTAAGETDLFLWKPGMRMERFRINVQGGNVHRRLEATRSVMAAFPGLSTRSVDGMIIIEGELDPSLMESYASVVEALPGILSMVKPIEVPMRQLIRVKAQMIEFDEQYRKRVGIRWADAAEGPMVGAVGTLASNDVYRLVPAGGNTNWGELLDVLPANNKSFHPFVGFSSALFSTIQLLEATGGAWTLAEPVLTTRSGESATFLSGGEFPYQTVDGNGNPVVNFRDYGVQLSIEPTADAAGNIMVGIEAEVSSIDLSSSVGSVPGLLTRRTDSVINVKSGETIIISGLLTTNKASSRDAVPGLGRLPVLGAMFRAREESENRRELVILVTPEIVTAPQAMPEPFAAGYEHMRTLMQDSSTRIDLLD
ncbi:type II and III secretion system protein family protein [Halopseudomonas yangmingensis]|nr:pilus assembly protein N-terminal domain-containing protein [Halopseudomonas yangmingensis]